MLEYGFCCRSAGRWPADKSLTDGKSSLIRIKPHAGFISCLNCANRVNPSGTIETTFTIADLSLSMGYTDWQPNRLAGAINANHALLDIKLRCHPDDRMGVIGFSGNAKLLHAPVSVRNGIASLKRSLSNPRFGWGTNFTTALKLAETCLFNKAPAINNGLFPGMLTELFVESECINVKDTKDLKRIIMLTDGDHNQGGSPLAVATRLKKAGVIIDCIGIGGSPADVNEDLLKQIASRNPDGSIRYCFIGDQQQLLQEYQTLARHIQVV